MAAPAGFPPNVSPPPVPDGWKAEWSTEYSTWFYLNLATDASQWEYPGPPQPQQAFSQEPDTSGLNQPLPTPPLQSPPLEQRQDIVAQEVPDGDRGLRKASANLGGGLLGVAGGLLAGALVAHEVDEHKDKHNLWTDGRKPMGAGLLASMGSRLPFGNTNTTASQSQGLGSFLPFGGNQPRLNIHCAAWCDQDVTQAVRRMVTPSQTLEIKTGDLVSHWGNPWPDNFKQFSILYSYGQRPWELLASGQDQGTLSLIPHQPLDNGRMEFVHKDPRSRIIALVWGFGNGLAGGKGKIEKLQELETTGEFPASNDWMGFDGWHNVSKTSVVYYRTGRGGIAIACAREGGTCRLPWNPLARWT